nr:hypothetical protein [Rhodanobacter glycinis]
MRLDHETRARGLQAFGQRLPGVHLQHQPEVTHRHVVAVDVMRGSGAHFIRRQMRHDLVAVEIEVDPALAGTALGTTQQVAVERARLRQRVDRKGEMEWRKVGHGRQAQGWEC